MLHRLLSTAVLVAAFLLASAAAASAQAPAPILVVHGQDGFSRYYPEILQAEGLNEYASAGVGELDAARLAGVSVVLLGPGAVGDAQVAALTSWVHAGGQLIAMRPDAKLAPLLGLGADAGDVAEGYVGIDTSVPPGKGITAQTMQFHGTADAWTTAGARTVASLYANADTPAGAPAVTLSGVGTQGGQAAAFAYDLGRSVVYTRQGNPAWAETERDHASPAALRASDMFFSNSSSTPDWADPARIAIPQADEQQRLLANLIGQMSLERMPLPRFWYLPRGERAAVVMTGDDHSSGRTTDYFEAFKAMRPPTCSVTAWDCVRATSYVYTDTPITQAEADAYRADGFELALHLNPGICSDPRDDAALRSRLTTQYNGFIATWGAAIPPRTNRTHCVAWHNWTGTAKVEAERGIRLDTNYYYFPSSWALSRPGVFTGSGFPMRFADTDGSLIDVYQAATQVTDELGSEPWGYVKTHVDALLDRALGADGYYGTFTVNMHTDELWPHEGAVAAVDAALARGVPVISADQLLTWLDGRNGSALSGLGYAGGRLSFTVAKAPGANGLEAMVPAAATGGALMSLTRDGVPVPTELRTVKGVAYHVFGAEPGPYVATYPPPLRPGPPADPGPPSGPAGGVAADRKAPRMRVKTRRARVSRRGKVTLRLACPADEIRCTVVAKLSRKGKRLARRRFAVAGGKTKRATLQLSKPAQRRLARDGKLKARLTLTVRDVAGNARTQRANVTLLAP